MSEQVIKLETELEYFDLLCALALAVRQHDWGQYLGIEKGTGELTLYT